MASSSTGNYNNSVSGSSPCGACKFLRRKCVADCIFAPYFCSEQGPARFAAIHKVFGASNVSKLLLHVPVPDRCEAVVTIAYEAQARIRDPVYGCVAHIFALQQQVAYLQTQLMQAKAQLAQTLIDSEGNYMEKSSNLPTGSFPNFPQSSLESAANSDEAIMMNNFQEESQSRSPEELAHQFQQFSRKRLACHGDVGELQALALRMMRN
ncbi:LOB domain-containing protein 16-like [Momordica charantia]|uniref:LOB domain-containing protein 16-like n=1 Tax=Momordica charantia TaxID=3673 RepID=A0A6J1CWX3_MOMCH|nr:LOB domain-containing protein 16-like [Momordica charantia]